MRVRSFPLPQSDDNSVTGLRHLPREHFLSPSLKTVCAGMVKIVRGIRAAAGLERNALNIPASVPPTASAGCLTHMANATAI